MLVFGDARGHNEDRGSPSLRSPSITSVLGERSPGAAVALRPRTPNDAAVLRPAISNSALRPGDSARGPERRWAARSFRFAGGLILKLAFMRLIGLQIQLLAERLQLGSQLGVTDAAGQAARPLSF